ncbi:signal peptidase I [Pseudarthrobacter sp. NIBRBAC000502772]|uniref:signal peptidase I n=1 Tax=Pseudarthrobacter sp. NIBRBAC000502772 TaxID=2590775 RepID=UPI001131273C|nr:signal peptidase I [Pseudarthrobacter sp. NIBRBAC000502772]QDG68912.1 signal peptidase I [Pseudarthrobacter sp. NIBRBAC000502772]
MPVEEAVYTSAEVAPRSNAVDGVPQRRITLAAVGKVLNFVVLMVAVFAALVLIVVPRATGSQTYTVLTNSMAPKFPPGTFLVMKPVAFGELKYGDVVTFQMYSGRPDVETHRIVGFAATQEGEKTLITKGDNNGVNDAEPVRELQVKGKLFYAVPYVGYAANALGHADRNLWVTLGATGLIGYGALLVVKGVRGRGRWQKAGVEGSE